ncbi:hypothetical protein ACVITL_002661 [Rhizobium pisi]
MTAGHRRAAAAYFPFPGDISAASETAVPQHAWLNQIVAVAQGRRPGGIEYDVFERL